MLKIGIAVLSLLLPVFTAGEILFADAKCNPGYQWMFNSLKQSPCDLAVSLAAPCWPRGYDIRQLASAFTYSGPASNNKCECNSVFYSALSACAYCQGSDFNKWSQHISSCSADRIFHKYPFNPPTEVPPWACLDVQELDEFDVMAAKLLSTTTWTSKSSLSSTPYDSSVSSTTTEPSVSSTINSSSSANPTSTTGAEEGSKISVGAAVAIVFGGIVVVGGLVTFCWFGSAAGQRSPQNQASYSSVPA